MKLAGAKPEWAILRHSTQTLAIFCNFYSFYHAGDSHGGECLFEQFTTQCIPYVI